MTRSDQFYSALGQRIRDARRRKGWTQVRLAEELGYGNPSSVSQWENGHRNPSAFVLRRIQELTGEKVAL